MPTFNFASNLRLRARENPRGRAVIAWERGDWRHLTFQELDEESDALARGLAGLGMRRGMRVILMVPPSLDYFALVYALFKLGATIALVDPGIGRRPLLRCLEEIGAEAFVGVPGAHLARAFYPALFRSVRIAVTVGPKLLRLGTSLASLRDPGPFEMEETEVDEPAAILFTSGTTGLPRGAIYTHGTFQAQVEVLRRTFGIEAGEVDLATFPPFAFLAPALGATAVIPDVDARNPGRADPVKVAHAIFTQGCTSLVGSPALLDNLARWAEKHVVALSPLRRVLCSGAPVPFEVLERLSRCLPPGAQIQVPYGATEALPLASISAEELLSDTRERTLSGAGVCVGLPIESATVRIIRLVDAPIEHWSDELVVPEGEVGEITVKGPMVTRAYWGGEERNRLAKIREGGETVHRTGDVGYFDEKGRLWLCGQKAQRVRTATRTLHTICVEEIYNRHPAVRRTALVGVQEPGAQVPVLVVEPEPEARLRSDVLAAELLALGEQHEPTREIRHILVYPRPFPLDARHNAKIHRDLLANWAALRLSGRRA